MVLIGVFKGYRKNVEEWKATVEKMDDNAVRVQRGILISNNALYDSTILIFG